ncbi:MAG: helix-turn-helix transcriptional regulator [Chitinophagaceae bacterium]|nr:helix-turn-helix transcriptional regulator [Chitinophagaceae bacterium]
MNCGQTLKVIRQWKGISQQQLADKMKISQQYISELESKEYFNDELLQKVLKALDVIKTQWEYFKNTPPPPPINKMKTLALAFLLASMLSLIFKRFPPSLPICVFSLSVCNEIFLLHTNVSFRTIYCEPGLMLFSFLFLPYTKSLCSLLISVSWR